MHPNDQPVEKKIGGVPMVFRDFENFKRAMGLDPYKNHGLELCLGCWSQMDEDLEEVIRHFSDRDEIFYVHFRDVEGTVPRFNETYLDEDEGNYDSYEILRLLDEVGFTG